ncbi:MAG: glycosyltransferase family 2 protein [Flavobacteriaceae bacterium]|nr:glycosyltransferase [Bacteroidia bacterium]NNL16863.1 glycosyltransferase family 2 protein [Flavobacteriaceae bacterium]
MQKPLISILTPFKNTSTFLTECLDSILNQTYTNWELIIVDDHSADTSFELVNDYAKKDNRIKLYKNPGSGIICALRFAFKQSRGDYITRMDSDDVMVDNKLDVLLKNLLNKGKGHVAIGLVKYFSAEGISDGYSKYELWINNLTIKGNNYSEIYKECVIPSPCWMTQRSDLIKCDAFNPDDYPEDYDLTFRMYKNKIKCIPCDTILHMWRDYSWRTSRTHLHYEQNYFLGIKTKYFIELDYNPKRPLVIWGAGFKGKTIAKYLIESGISFNWICDNPNKIGKKIYNQTLQHFNYLSHLNQPQSIVTVANTEAQKQIRSYLKVQNQTEMTDYFFFC